MGNKTKKWMAGACVACSVAAAFGIVSRALTHKLIKVALERDGVKKVGGSERAKRWLLGFETSTEFEMERLVRARRLEEIYTSDVSITSMDGISLAGHFYRQARAKRTVIAMHGWRSSWSKDFGMISEFMHKNDCNVLYVEQRGQNNSGGQYITFGLLERYDCLSWIEWLCNQKEGFLPIYLAGISMGATTVLLAVELELPECVHGIIADSAFTSPYEIWKHIADNNLHLPHLCRPKTISAICKGKIEHDVKECTTLKAVALSNVPILFIHGCDDHFVPIEMTYSNYKMCAAPKRILVVPGADHGMSYYCAKGEYESAVLSFWKEFD